MLKNKPLTNLIEFFKFLTVGIIATTINLLTYYMLIKINLNASLAYSIGYLTSLLFNYFLTIHFTFKTKHSNSKGTKFLFTHIFNYLFQLFILNVLLLTTYQNIAPILTPILYIPISFLLVRKIIR